MEQPTLIAGPTGWTRGARKRRVSLNVWGQERQHFLLRAKACTISELKVARYTDDEAYAKFEELRFSETKGVPFCPHCGTLDAYRMTINRRTKAGLIPTRIYKCRVPHPVCGKQFSVTSGTIFASRKMPIRDILLALLAFANGVSGRAALALRRTLGCSYKSAFVLEGKVRESIVLSRPTDKLHGVVEVDGTEIGGHFRKARVKKNGKEGRVGEASLKKSIVALRERRPGGHTRVGVFDHELRYQNVEAGTDFVRDNVVFGTQMISDEGFSLGNVGPHARVKHKEGYKNDAGIHTNGVEGFFSRVKRAEGGVYYGIVGPNVDLYAEEIAWREDYRHESNERQWKMLIKAVTHAPVSRRWSGYWQRWQQDGVKRRNRRFSPRLRLVT